MGREEDTIPFLRSDRLGNSVELLYTAYLPMLTRQPAVLTPAYQ